MEEIVNKQSEIHLEKIKNTTYAFQEIPKLKKKHASMCSKCRYHFYFDAPFGPGWTACSIMTNDKSNWDCEISSIPLEIRNNCPGFEKKTLFSCFKKARSRIIYFKS